MKGGPQTNPRPKPHPPVPRHTNGPQDWRSSAGAAPQPAPNGAPPPAPGPPRPPAPKRAATASLDESDLSLYDRTARITQYANEGNRDGVLGLAEGVTEVDAWYLTAVAQAYHKLALKDRLETLLQRLAMDRALPVNAKLCNCLLQAVACYDDETFIRKVEGIMDARRIKFTEYTYTILLDYHYGRGELRKAEELYHRMQTPGSGCTPSYVTHNVMIQALQEQERWAEIHDLHRTPVGNRIARDSTFNALISAYGNAGDLPRMVATKEEMEQNGFKPTPLTFVALLRGFGRAEQWPQVNAAKEEAFACGLLEVEGWNTIVRAYKDAKDAAGALAAVEEMRTKGVEPDANTYAVLLVVHGRGDDAAAVEATLADMAAAGIARTEAIYAALLNGFGHFGDVLRLQTLLTEAQAEGLFNRTVWNAALCAFVDARGLRDVKALWETATVPGGCGLNAVGCRGLLTYFGHLGSLEEIYRLRGYMAQHGIAETPTLQNALLTSFASCHAEADVLTMYEELRERLTVPRCNLFLRAFADVHRPDQMRCVVEHMHSCRMAFDAETYCCLAEGYSRFGMKEEAVQILSGLESSNIQWTAEVFASAIRASGRLGDIDAVERHWWRAHDAGLLTEGVVVQAVRAWRFACCRQRVVDLVHDMPRWTSRIASAMTYALGDMHAFDLIPQVLTAMEKHQVPILHYHYAALILVYGLDRKFDEVEKFLGLMKSSGLVPHFGLYHALLAIYIMARRDREAEAWLHRMAGDCGVLPKTVILIARVARRTRPRCDFDAIGVPLRYQVPLTVRQKLLFYSYTKQRDLLAATIAANNVSENAWLITLYCEAGMRDAIEKVRSESAVKLNLSQYKILIKYLCQVQELDHAHEELQLAIEDGHASHAYLWSPIICAHCKGGDVDLAELLLFRMTQHGARPTLYMYNSFLRMYLVKGLARQAKGMLERMETDSITPNFVTALILRFFGAGIDGLLEGTASLTFGCSMPSSVDLESLADMDLDDLLEEDAEDLYDAL